jgi:acyl-CoA thioesterase-2
VSDLKDLLAALELQPAEDAGAAGGFTAGNMDEGHGVVFGGQLLAQAVVAATRAVEGKELKSLHTIFARSARPDAPLAIDVDTMHEGRAFGSTTITIRQNGKVCTRSLALLHAPDDDLVRYAGDRPDAGRPEDWARLDAAGSLWDVRIAGDVDISDPAVGPPTLDVWARFDGAPADPVTGQALLAYASDGFLIATAMRPHEGLSQADAHVRVSTTVLSQTITFHEPVDASDWLLLAHRSPYAGRGRSYGQADVWSGDRLVASYVQENMIRAFPEGAAPAAGERARH